MILSGNFPYPESSSEIYGCLEIWFLDWKKANCKGDLGFFVFVQSLWFGRQAGVLELIFGSCAKGVLIVLSFSHLWDSLQYAVLPEIFLMKNVAFYYVL
jgi:hypothetical protein